jgi:hypothetical protein
MELKKRRYQKQKKYHLENDARRVMKLFFD